MHHVRDRADRSPVRFAQDSQPDQHQWQREKDRHHGHPYIKTKADFLRDDQSDARDDRANADPLQRKCFRTCAGRRKTLKRFHENSPAKDHSSQAAGNKKRRRRPHDPEQHIVFCEVRSDDSVMHERVGRNDPRDDRAQQHAGIDSQADEHSRSQRQQTPVDADAGRHHRRCSEHRDGGEPRENARIFGHQHQRGGRNRADRKGARGQPRVRAFAVKDDEGLTCGQAVRIGELFVDDEVLAHRNRQQNPEQAGGGEPCERLQWCQCQLE